MDQTLAKLKLKRVVLLTDQEVGVHQRGRPVHQTVSVSREARPRQQAVDLG